MNKRTPTFIPDSRVDGKGGFKSEETEGFLLLQDKYSKLLSWAEHLNFLPKTVNNVFKFSAQDSDLNIYFGEVKILQNLLTDLKSPLILRCNFLSRRAIIMYLILLPTYAT